MNLINDAWIPVIRKSGPDFIRPWEITDTSNPVLSLNLTRPDFNGSMVQFLIGLFQTVLMPKNEKEWEINFKKPPTPEELKKACQIYQHAFNLGGDGPRFMQDLKLSEDNKDIKPLASLLIDEPGENTLKNNGDLFIKRHRAKAMSLPFVAVSLFTLQLNAPSGGSGHRTSLRGGGPLTTLAISKDPEHQRLWDLVWMNILSKESAKELFKASDTYHFDDINILDSDIFPWLAPTKTSEDTQVVRPQDTHWLQLYWGMPRRIKLRFDSKNFGTCPISGQPNSDLLTEYVTKNYGINYLQWKHPLSPYYKNKDEWLPLHPNVGGMTYKHWLGWTIGSDDKSSQALIIKTCANRYGVRAKYHPQLWAFGYDMDNMKARGWQEAKMPLLNFESQEMETAFRSIVILILGATEEVVKNLKGTIKKAWGVDKGGIGFVESEFWQTTENQFYELLDEIRVLLQGNTGDNAPELRRQWHTLITKKALEIFDYWVMSSDISLENTQKIISERKNLQKFNYSKSISAALCLVKKSNKEVN